MGTFKHLGTFHPNLAIHLHEHSNKYGNGWLAHLHPNGDAAHEHEYPNPDKYRSTAHVYATGPIPDPNPPKLHPPLG